MRLAVLVGDTCAVDFSERARASNIQPTLKEIGIAMGVSRESVRLSLISAVHKVRTVLRVHSGVIAIETE